jgi:ribosome biogenesis GTPase / thiamine phosphate phosphatase
MNSSVATAMRCRIELLLHLSLLLLLLLLLVSARTMAFTPSIRRHSNSIASRRRIYLTSNSNSNSIIDQPEQVSELQRLGWQPHFADQITHNETRAPVRITSVHSNGLNVMGDGIQITILPVAGATVGDWLLIDRGQPNYKSTRLDRKSIIKRRAPGSGRKVQLIAANLDTVFVVSSCNQDFNVARMERYVALALEAGVNPVIVLTKSDLAEDDLEYYREDAAEVYDRVPVVLLDARNQDEVREVLAEWCQPGQTVAFLGSSGVGKSTLVNSLCGSLVASTKSIREDDGKGRHTTSSRQLHFAQCAILDTPGMRELQLMDAASGVADMFADIVELTNQCRFSDCQHDTEPGCAINASIEKGDLDPGRFLRWLKLAAEEQENSERMKECKAKEEISTKTFRKSQQEKRSRANKSPK